MRQRFDSKGWQNKHVGLTLRFNAFINASNRPAGFHTFPTDGEGIDVYNAMKQNHGTDISNVIHWFNIMLYDIEPETLGASGGLTLNSYT